MAAQLPMESNLGSQAGDLVAILGVNVRENGVSALSTASALPTPSSPALSTSSANTYRRNLPGQINILGQAQLALLERALEIRLLNGVTRIALLVDQRDQTVLDLQMHFGALADFLLEVTGCLDGELLAAVSMSVRSLSRGRATLEAWHSRRYTSRGVLQADARLGWVGVEVDLLNLQDVVGRVGAEVQRVVAGHLELFFHGDLVGDPRGAQRGSGRHADGAEASE